jgi:hypothetical protein
VTDHQQQRRPVLTAVVAGAEEAEVQAAEVEVEVEVVEVAGAGVARVPRRDQHRWRQRRSNRRYYRSRSNPCPGRER